MEDKGSGGRRLTDLLNSPVSNSVFRFATVSGQNIHWFLKRNCSVTPSQLGWLYASLCVVSLGIGTVFWLHGAPLVLPFAWLELAAVGFAFMAYARHATDGERIMLQAGRLVVELENGGATSARNFFRTGCGSSLNRRPIADRVVGPGSVGQGGTLCAAGVEGRTGARDPDGVARRLRGSRGAARLGLLKI